MWAPIIALALNGTFKLATVHATANAIRYVRSLDVPAIPMQGVLKIPDFWQIAYAVAIICLLMMVMMSCDDKVGYL